MKKEQEQQSATTEEKEIHTLFSMWICPLWVIKSA
jgi:hypothetical protein